MKFNRKSADESAKSGSSETVWSCSARLAVQVLHIISTRSVAAAARVRGDVGILVLFSPVRYRFFRFETVLHRGRSRWYYAVRKWGAIPRAKSFPRDGTAPAAAAAVMSCSRNVCRWFWHYGTFRVDQRPAVTPPCYDYNATVSCCMSLGPIKLMFFAYLRR